MGDFQTLVRSAGETLAGLWSLIQSLAAIVGSHWVFVLWIVFWTFLVRWPDFRRWLSNGAWAPLLLIYIAVSFTWAVNSGPTLNINGLPLGSLGEKLFIGAVWIAFALLCGRVQDILGVAPPEKEIAGPPDGVPTEPGQTQSHGHGAHAAAHGHH